MKFQIPFTFSTIDKLKKQSKFFSSFFKPKRNTMLEEYLENSGEDITREQYLGICLRSSVTVFILFAVLGETLIWFLKINISFLIPLLIALLIGGFLFFTQVYYPKSFTDKKERDIEKNLLAALDDMHVQLNSGIPIFSILVNISAANYGALSEEFKRVVRKINAGLPQVDVLEEVGEKNSSNFFKRTLWQMSNGMRAGSDLAIVVKDSIRSLNEEQLVQIQDYGNKLNPMIMFYMLVSVIIPALAITFLTIITSLIGLDQKTNTGIFVGLFLMVSFIQIMFLGVIKSLRPSLL